MDLYGWILERITTTERSVRDQADAMWQVYLGDDSAARVIFRRCEADRKLLTIHKPRHVTWPPSYQVGLDGYVCEGCGQEGICQDWVTEHANDCPVLLAVAEGYGLTEEILAGLDRPQAQRPEPAGQSVLGEAVAKAWETAVRASLQASVVSRDAFVLTDAAEPTPREKALSILEPELRTIPLYQSGEESP